MEVQVESIDKGGNFIGWMFVDNVNLSVALVEGGLSKIHYTAERSSYYKELLVAEEKAKNKRIGVWTDFKEEVRETQVVDDSERKPSYKKIIVTDVVRGVDFWAQHVDNGNKIYISASYKVVGYKPCFRFLGCAFFWFYL